MAFGLLFPASNNFSWVGIDVTYQVGNRLQETQSNQILRNNTLSCGYHVPGTNTPTEIVETPAMLKTIIRSFDRGCREVASCPDFAIATDFGKNLLAGPSTPAPKQQRQLLGTLGMLEVCDECHSVRKCNVRLRVNIYTQMVITFRPGW